MSEEDKWRKLQSEEIVPKLTTWYMNRCSRVISHRLADNQEIEIAVQMRFHIPSQEDYQKITDMFAEMKEHCKQGGPSHVTKIWDQYQSVCKCPYEK